MVAKVVTNMGTMVRSRGMLYKAVVQLVLLYGSYSWVVIGAVIKVLKVFNYQVARSIAGMTAQHTTIGEWECPPLAEVVDTSGIWPIKKYIQMS